MDKTKTIQLEGANFIYEEDKLIGFIKKDNKTRQNIIYKIEEASCDEISELIGKLNPITQ
jgi:hypothetical protein